MAEKKNETLADEFSNWGGGAKTARPVSVGPHAPLEGQEDMSNPGINPEKGYKPAVGDNNNKIGPDAPGGPVNIPVKGADNSEGGVDEKQSG